MASDRDQRNKKLLAAEVSNETHQRFKNLAHDQRTSVSGLLRDAIFDKLDEFDAQQNDRPAEAEAGD